MARDFGALVGAHVDDAGVVLESSGGLLFLMPLSIISMSSLIRLITHSKIETPIADCRENLTLAKRTFELEALASPLSMSLSSLHKVEDPQAQGIGGPRRAGCDIVAELAALLLQFLTCWSWNLGTTSV
ncbi:hypothetical protein FH972_019465 [Carpinus fangiana]|uniref:Uncharacterized protein n=1 Tax=Carpinus fangiana TaxID=176857 RepID=A0A5N6RQC7_9ROSI|nr:hypothetical protein FH972_019465 [Carpinus fangiana]